MTNTPPFWKPQVDVVWPFILQSFNPSCGLWNLSASHERVMMRG